MSSNGKVVTKVGDALAPAGIPGQGDRRALPGDQRGEPALVYVGGVRGRSEQYIGAATSAFVFACAITLDLARLQAEAPVGLIWVAEQRQSLQQLSPMLGWTPEMLANWLASDAENARRVNAAAHGLRLMTRK